VVKLKTLIPWFIGVLVLIGMAIRLYHITANQFLFYDEGMYIGYNRAFLDLVANNPAHNLGELAIILGLILKAALSTPKALWFLILNLRVFILGTEAWYFARLVSAISGLATVVLIYFWALRFLQSKRIAVLSALTLLLLPSHVFYSRLGMQESFSTVLFLSAIFLYMLNSRLSWSFFVSAFLLACVYLTNYRMIIGPVFIALIEGFHALDGKAPFSFKSIKWQKIAIYAAVFYGVVFLVGCLFGGINLYVNFAWMFHQAQDAGGKFNPINFLSYPYYTFSLEGFFFACFFWWNLALIKEKKYAKLLPFGMVALQMLGFSLAAEKGARYLCVVLPFMAVAAAVAIDDCWERFKNYRTWIATAVGLGLCMMIYFSVSLSLATTDYENAVHFVTDNDPDAVIVTTQPLVEALYMQDEHRIVPCPNDLQSLIDLYKKGARYLILDPQAYISWDVNGRRFSPPLYDFLETALKQVHPLQVFPHLNKILLKRFVLDHNEQILDSIHFLSNNPNDDYGKIRLYDLGAVLKMCYNNQS